MFELRTIIKIKQFYHLQIYLSVKIIISLELLNILFSQVKKKEYIKYYPLIV